MYEELIQRLKEFASIPEHCENVADCDKCTKEEICLSFTNKRIIEVATQAANAIEELQKKYDGAVSDNKSLCRQIAELAKERNEAYSKGLLEGGIAQRAEDKKWVPLPEPPKGES